MTVSKISDINIYDDFDLTSPVESKTIKPNKKYYIRLNDIKRYENKYKIYGISYHDNVCFKYLTKGVFSFIYTEKKDKLLNKITIIVVLYSEHDHICKEFKLIIKED